MTEEKDLQGGPELGPQKPWAEIYNQLDQGMPEDQYNALRLQYFNSEVRPRIKTGESVQATYKAFLQRTERPLSIRARQMGEAIGRMAVEGAGLTLGGELLGPLVGAAATQLMGETKLAQAASKVATGGVLFGTYDAAKAKDGDRVNAAIRGAGIGAAWEAGLGMVFGFSEKAPEAITKAAMNEKVPPVSEGVAEEWNKLGNATPWTKEQIDATTERLRNRRAWDFSMRDADTAKVGGEVVEPGGPPAAPLTPSQELDMEVRERGRQEWERRAAQLGVTEPRRVADLPTEIGLTPEQRAQMEAVQRAALEKAGVQLPTQRAATEIQAAQVAEARAKGYLTGPMLRTPTIKGLRVILRDAQDQPQILTIAQGKESEAIGIVEETLAKGGAIDGIHYHPASEARATEFMRYFADKAESEEQPFRMKVYPGQAVEHARYLNKLGLRATVLDDATLNIGPEVPWRKAQQARQLQRTIDEQKTGKLIPSLPDDISKTMMRIGELRNQSRQAVSSRDVYKELHHLRGIIGSQYGLTIDQVGQLGLRYFERNAGAEAPESAIALLERYKGRGAPFGAEVGKPAPKIEQAESRLEGFKLPAPASEREIELDLGGTHPAIGTLRTRPSGETFLTAAARKPGGYLGGQFRDPEFGPLRVVPADWEEHALYHEGIHDGIDHSGLVPGFSNFLEGHEEAGQGIMTGLRKIHAWAYGRMSPDHLANEAFTHAAEAIRMGDSEKMAQLAGWDTSEDAVKEMVNGMAGKLYEASMTHDTAPIRAFQRRMNDLVRRTSPNITEALSKGQLYGYTTWFDPETASWVMQDGEGRQILKNTLHDVHDQLERADPSSHFPDIMHDVVQFRSMPGPLVPPGMEPIDAPATLESEEIPLSWGAQGLQSIYRPTLDWAAGVQAKLDKYGIDLDFYGAITRIDSARKAADPVMDQLATDRDQILKGIQNPRRLDYGEVLARDPSQWQGHASELNLDTDDLSRIRSMADWSDANVREGGVSLTDTLNQMHRVREAGGDLQRAGVDPQSAIGRAIRNGELGYSDLQVGRVSQWVIRQSINDRFMGEPIKALEDLAKTKKSSGSGELLFKDLQWPIRNYANYMKGIPDASQRIINSFIEFISQGINAGIAKVNQVLGTKINPVSMPRELMAKYQLLLYTAGLGARPAVFLRDTFQSFNAFTVMGPSAFFEGMQKALTEEGRAMAHEAGATIQGRRLGETFGDITGDLPVSSGRMTDYAVKAADALLAPSRYGHNIGRQIAYLGEYSRALREIGAFRRGEIDAIELADRTGAWFQDPAPRSRLLAMAAPDSGLSVEQAAQNFGLAMNDATQFALRSGTQSAGLRTGTGRIFGQYGTWPSNYAQFLRKLGARSIEKPSKGLPALGMFMGMNYMAWEGARSLGIDAAKWLWFSPAGYAGSPNLEMLQNLLVAPEESAQGLEARRKLHELPWEFVPTGVEFRSILRAIEGGEVNVPRLLGFKPLEGRQEEDFDDWLKQETGFQRPPRTP